MPGHERPLKIQVQVWFVVVRPQVCVPVLVELAHAPLAQRYEVTVRLCVPVLSQVLVNPPHAPHAP